jgi:hypothetical protein
MKKLVKLQINAKKLIKNEELLTLRGGYGPCHCYTNYYMTEVGWFYVNDWQDCYDACWNWFNTGESIPEFDSS